MPLSWNEIKSRALAFSREWKGEGSERAEAQSFWNGFFAVFGIDRKRVAVFGKRVEIARSGRNPRAVRLAPSWRGVRRAGHQRPGQVP